jgi:hypothetical protein
MSIFCYNDYNGRETVDKEYKLFTFHPKGTTIDPNDETYAESLLASGKWIFNEPVMENLDYYLTTYLPKYTTAFLNKSSESENGEMYIGISDDGFIQGIPYQGEISLELIKSKVNTILDSDLISSEYNLKEYINVEVIKVDTSDFSLLPEHNNIIENYFSQKKIYTQKLNKYMAKKKKWCHMMDYYGNKLHVLLNEPISRSELLRYVKLKAPKNKTLRYLLRSSYKFEHKFGYEVSDLKQDEDSAWYWVTRWKDEMTDFVKTLKPQPPVGISNRIYPLNIITTIVDMIPHWIHYTSNNINLFLIKISFQKPDLDLEITYKGFDGEYIHCYRSTQESGPFCKPC